MELDVAVELDFAVSELTLLDEVGAISVPSEQAAKTAVHSAPQPKVSARIAVALDVCEAHTV